MKGKYYSEHCDIYVLSYLTIIDSGKAFKSPFTTGKYMNFSMSSEHFLAIKSNMVEFFSSNC